MPMPVHIKIQSMSSYKEYTDIETSKLAVCCTYAKSYLYHPNIASIISFV